MHAKKSYELTSNVSLTQVMWLDQTMPTVSLQLNFSHNQSTRICRPQYRWLRENGMLVSVHVNICWENSPNSSRRFHHAHEPKTINYNGKLRFWQRRFLQKNLGFGVGLGYRNNTRHLNHQTGPTQACSQEIGNICKLLNDRCLTSKYGC